MSRNKTAEWQPFETAPKDGTELIFWVSSQKRVSGHDRQLLFFKGTMVVGRHRSCVEAS